MTLILNGTDNSATTPAVTGTDTDTGIYYPAANQVAIATAGTQAMLVDSSQNVTFAQAANLPNTFGFKNRIINGAMVIDQRNAGASASLTSSQTYFVDRFFGVEDTDGTMTIQRSTTAPTGFINSLLMTTTSADASLGATQICYVGQKIEGLNVADFAWGTASAATVTISFWVRSSLTGTFGGAVANNAFNRSYPFTYTISLANTFEYKTITIAGDTTGTWPTDNGGSIQVFLGLGVGSTYSGTAGAWAGAGYISATGATSVIGTNGATFYITGVQLEKGSTATSFDYRPYGTEFALCQRYFETNYGVGYAIGSANSYPNNQGVQFQGFNTTSGQKHVYDWFKVPKRTAPTAVFYDYAGNASKYTSLDGGGTATNNQTIGYTPLNQNNLAVGATSTTYGIAAFWTASAEL